MQKTLTELNKTYISEVAKLQSHLIAKLKKIGLLTIGDCLLHFPLRYLDKTTIKTIDSITLGEYNLLRLKIIYANLYSGNKQVLLCKATDGSAQINLRFYNFIAWHQKNIKAGNIILCWGEIRFNKSSLEIYQPEYQLITNNKNIVLDKNLTPVYPSTKGLTQKTLIYIINTSLNLLHDNEFSDLTIPSQLMPDFATKYNLKSALLVLHKPKKQDIEKIINRTHNAIKYLCFEEFLAHSISLKQLKHKTAQTKSHSMQISTKLEKLFDSTLNFTMTKAQKRVIAEIKQDISQAKPMMRLLQGDVGSGKTIVAIYAALICIENGFQVAFMAPTEILAEQIYLQFIKWSEVYNFKIALVISKLSKKTYDRILTDIKNKTINLIVGTHAIFQKKVEFNNLGLIIIDEQHRFGVNQRMELQYKSIKTGYLPHQLVMSATPIPRTLAMSLYADLDISIIDEMPSNRIPIKTAVISSERRDEVIARVQQKCLDKSQVYWVCTLIEESEALQCQAVEKVVIELQDKLPNIKIGLIHGKMNTKEKQEVMNAFKDKNIQLLVATTVIEVGIDIPNANLMIIENSERMGLSQLHQLRGRVGRSGQASYCILLYQPPLSLHTQKRLKIIRSTTDGFAIARQDMQLRGIGEFLGTKQAGLVSYKIANLELDSDLMQQTINIADQLIVYHPQFAKLIYSRWLSNSIEKYAKV